MISKEIFAKVIRKYQIGRVLFIVEGSQTEFSILRRVFCNLLGYSYILAVINTRESNIRDISENESYLDDVFDRKG